MFKVKVLNLREIFANLDLEKPKESVTIKLWGTKNNEAIPITFESEEISASQLKEGVEEIKILKNDIYVNLGDINSKNIDNSSTFYINIYKSMAKLAKIIKKYFENFSVIFPDSPFTNECLFGLTQSLYQFNSKFFLNSGEFSSQSIKLIFNKDKYSEIFEISKAQCMIRFLGDIPSNFLKPSTFVEYAQLLFKPFNEVTLEVLDQEQCLDIGMNLFYSVAQGSSEPGKLLTLKYFNKSGSDDHHIALVGKGVCFDSGGISLKPSKDMKEMKMDMLGGATMLSAFYLCVYYNLPINISCVIPLVENMPSAKATKPGDVFISFNGLSVEVDDTDAEGRLILADSICYTQSKLGKKPFYLIDAATLTGSVVVALGNIMAGYFTNNDELSDLACECASLTNEPIKRMPLSKLFLNSMKSNVADICHCSNQIYADACHAAAFLNEFVENNVKFPHFDISGVAMEGFPKEIYGNEASGRPLKCLFEIIKNISKNFN